MHFLGAIGLATSVIGCGRTTADNNPPEDANTGGASGAATTSAGGSSGGNLYVHDCQGVYSDTNPPPREICFFCDPLPAGSTGGCGVPTDCYTTDPTSPIRYPVGCEVVFPWQAMFSYETGWLQVAFCVDDASQAHWNCAW